MINLQAVLITNGAAIVLLSVLLFSARKTVRFSQPDCKILYLMTFLNVVQCLIEPMTFIVDGRIFFACNITARLLNCLLFINNIVFSFLWTVYSDLKLFADIDRIKRIYPFVAIPAVLIVIGAFANLFVPVFFSINAENVYQRTLLALFPWALTYLYLSYGVFMIYRYREKASKYLFLPAVLFMIPILISSVLQFFAYGLSVIWLGSAIALVSLYVNVQNEASCTDTLSGLFTRQYMMNFIKALIRRSGTRPFSGIMLDIDRFKMINDTYGHMTGDDAIRSVGKILRECVGKKDLAVRFAGDEFMIILSSGNEAEIFRTIDEIKKKTDEFNSVGDKKYLITFSFGYGIFNPAKDTVDSFLNSVDGVMYKEKRQKYSILMPR